MDSSLEFTIMSINLYRNWNEQHFLVGYFWATRSEFELPDFSVWLPGLPPNFCLSSNPASIFSSMSVFAFKMISDHSTLLVYQ